MKIEIDQSGRVEYTSHDTVVANSRGEHVWISMKDKRTLQQIYRQMNRPRMFALETFSFLVAYLCHRSTYGYLDNIFVLDKEYLGNEDRIKSLVLLYTQSLGGNLIPPQLHFDYIGKKSLAHKTAYEAFKRKRRTKASRVSVDKVIKLVSQ